jgi:hypothetical protein
MPKVYRHTAFSLVWNDVLNFTKELSTAGTSQLNRRDHLLPVKQAKSPMNGVIYEDTTEKAKIRFFGYIS